MPKPRPGESEEEFVARCIPDIVGEGRPQDEAIATCYSIYEQEKEVKQMPNEKGYDEMVSEKPTTWATSFVEYEAEEAAEEAVEEIAELTKLFNAMVQNIMFNYDVQDRVAALESLTQEYQVRVVALMEDGGIKATTFDDTDWDGSASNWDTAEAYCRDCLIDLNTGTEKTKSMCKLPYRKPGSTAPNKGALRTMATGRGLSAVTKPADVSQQKFDQQKKKAANRLISWWPDAFGTDAPESIYQAAGKKRPAEKAFAQFQEWIEEIKGFFLGIKSLDVLQDGFKITKSIDGTPWIMLWSTNAFIDREKEIFETKAIDDFIERHKDDDVKGEVWFWHLPGSKFADIKLQARVGRFLLEAAPFDDTEMGQAFKAFFEEYPSGHPLLAPHGWGQSHGYRFKRKDRVNGVYTAFEKHESTVLPWDIAANQHNPRPLFVKETGLMNEKQKEAFEKVFGPELTAQMVSLGETKTAELEATGVEYKEVTEETVVEEAVEEKAEDAVEEVVEEEVVETQTDETAEETEEVKETETAVEETEPETEEKQVEAPVSREEITEGLKVLVEELTQKFESMVDEKVSAAVDELVEVVVPLAKQLKDMTDSEETKIAKAVQETPTSSIASIISGSIIGAKETQVDGRTTLAKDGPEEAETKAGNGPSIAGVKLNLWNN